MRLTILIMFLISLLSCSKEQKKISNAETIRINIDLEDHIFRINETGEWYGMDKPIQDCSPLFLINYSYANRAFLVEHCESEGEILYDQISIENDDCSTEILEYNTEVIDGMTHSFIKVSDEFNHCLFEENDFFILSIVFDFND